MNARKWFGAWIAPTAIVLLLVGSVTMAAPRGGNSPNDEILARLDDIDAQLTGLNTKLATVETKLGCSIDEFLDPSANCTQNPATTSVSFCISQGRVGELSMAWDAELYAEVKAGAGWTLGPWGEMKGSAEVPLFLGGFIPLPTEAAVSGSAGLGRGLDICFEVPIQPSATDIADVDNIVRGINSQTSDKFRNRLSRIIAFADRRAPNVTTSTGAFTRFDTSDPEGDEYEFERLDDAMERFMAGQFQLPTDGPLGILKDPIIQDLRVSLGVPAPLQQLLDDPDAILGRLPGPIDVANACQSFGISGPLRSRFAGLASHCDRFDRLSSLGDTIATYERIEQINNLLSDLPDEIIFGVGDILPNVNAPGLPQPRPPGSRVCQTFPRLCR